MRNLYIVPLCIALSSCSVLIINSDENNISNQAPTRERCEISKTVFEDTPKIPIEKIIASGSNYKEKSKILVDYISNLRLYIAEIKKTVKNNDNENSEKCSK